MTTPTVLPTQYAGTYKDFLKVKTDRSGAARVVAGTVSVPSGTTANSYVGLVPFVKGARFVIGDKSVYCNNFGAGTTTINLGYVYDDNVTYTNDVDAWASLSTAAQSGGFITVDEKEGASFVAAANGWVTAQLIAADADATADIAFNFVEAYDGLSTNNSNSQS
jgi:hypothetical protein